jgi:hypothetical protein
MKRREFIVLLVVAYPPDHSTGGAAKPGLELQSAIRFRSASPQQAEGTSSPAG